MTIPGVETMDEARYRRDGFVVLRDAFDARRLTAEVLAARVASRDEPKQLRSGERCRRCRRCARSGGRGQLPSGRVVGETVGQDGNRVRMATTACVATGGGRGRR
jgi:hypothetical protein